MSDQIQVQVRYFASLRQATDTASQSLQLPAGSTVEQLLGVLAGQHPRLSKVAGAIYAAVNRTYVERNAPLQDGDEVALFPPVSGGADASEASSSRSLFEITERPLSLDEVAARVAGASRGAITVFAGVVRGHTELPAGNQAQMLDTDYLEYEAYVEMAEPMLAQIGAEVQERWPQVEAISIVHRVGRLEVGEPSVVIAVAAAHRRGTFDACSYAIERLKAIVPIWKKEVGSDGQWWVEGPRGGNLAQPVLVDQEAEDDAAGRF